VETRGVSSSDARRAVDLGDYTVDLFGDVAVLSTYVEGVDEQGVAAALAAEHGLRAVYVKRRPKKAQGAVTFDLAPTKPIWGSPVDSVVAVEQGMKFEIRPANGLSVGLYVDAREARAWVFANTLRRTVLNLFSYTCGFGVAARLGGATRAVNVDLSRKVLDWGEANYALNGLTIDKRDFVAGDTFEWIKRFEKKGERFELVVLDPPSFATSGRTRFSAAKDYPKLLAQAAQLGDVVLACCNLVDAPREKWVREAGLTVRQKLPGALNAVISSRT